MKKIIYILVITLLISSLCACSNSEKDDGRPDITVAPASDFKYGELDGYIVITEYLADDEYVSVPEEIDGKKVKVLGGFAGKNLREIIIPDSVESIRFQAFAQCYNLRKVYWSDNITEIEDAAFDNCIKLQLNTLPENLKKIGGSAFSNCGKITEITIPKTVEEIGGYAFLNTALTSVTFEEGIEEISGEGNFCSTKLEHITLPASIKKIGDRPFAPNLKTVTFLGDAPEITHEDPFRFITPEDTEIHEVIIKYDKNTKGWDTTPLRDNYTLEAY